MNTESTYKNILLKIENIKSVFDRDVLEIPTDAGLMGGTCGIILFYLYHFKLTNSDNSLKKATILLQQILESDLNINPTFCNGFSGLGWLLYHIEEFFSDEITLDTKSIMKDIDPFLENYMATEIKANRYDYLHNALGCGLYFLKGKPSILKQKRINKLISTLLKNAEFDDSLKTIRWEGYLNEQGNGVYNMGLSHGIPSILVFLCKAYSINPDQTILKKEHIEYVTNYILSTKNTTNSNSIFPYSVSKEHELDSRLGWCYGDLGVIIALIHANKILKKTELEKEIHCAIKHNLNRIDLEENLVRDAGLCHGTAGIAHIFNTFYKEYNVKEYRKKTLYWYNETLKMAKFEDGIAGFKAFQPSLDFSWHSHIGLLEGTSGIGLALIYAIDEKHNAWDEFDTDITK